MVKTKPNQKIHVDKLKTTLDKLGQLKEKPKEELTLRESIYYLRDKLKSALKKGYSYQDLSEILESQEILISAATLKQYLTDINKESVSRRKRTKSVKARGNKGAKVSPGEVSLATSSSAESNQDLSLKTKLSKRKLKRDLNQADSHDNDENLADYSTLSQTREKEITKSEALSEEEREIMKAYNFY